MANTLNFIVQNTRGALEGLRVELNAVPEPASLAMLGLFGLSRLRRTRNRAVAST